LAERTVKPDVVLIVLPVEIIERTYNARDVAGGEDDDETEAGTALDFRGMLKASCMRLRLPMPLRGTLLRFDKDQALLYTRGSVLPKMR
jgi:hypothetical protein